jgi:F-type H+-transporting ATPase subunit b
MPQLDPTVFVPQLVWLAISFLLLYALMTWVALPKVGRVIEQRRARIETDLSEAHRLRAEAEAVFAAYERSLVEARTEAQAVIRQTMDRLGAEAAERQRVAAARLAESTSAAEARIAVARSAALANVRDVAVEVATAAAVKLIGGSIDGALAGAAVDAAMKERA